MKTKSDINTENFAETMAVCTRPAQVLELKACAATTWHSLVLMTSAPPLPSAFLGEKCGKGAGPEESLSKQSKGKSTWRTEGRVRGEQGEEYTENRGQCTWRTEGTENKGKSTWRTEEGRVRGEQRREEYVENRGKSTWRTEGRVRGEQREEYVETEGRVCGEQREEYVENRGKSTNRGKNRGKSTWKQREEYVESRGKSMWRTEGRVRGEQRREEYVENRGKG
ncbi:hypothetical protein STEG23_011675 [Scotinomys teguina]